MLASRPAVLAPVPSSKSVALLSYRPFTNARLVRRGATTDSGSSFSSLDGTGTGAGESATAVVDAPPVEARVPWFKKPCLFKELASVEELEAAVSSQGNDGKMSVVDFYAGWCACCKSSYPTLCKIPNSEFLSQNYNFYKANIEEGNLAAFIKKKGVRGIPHVLVFNRDGSDVIGMSAAFKKMELLRRNLDIIARAEVKDFVLDPNGIVVNR